MTDAAALMDRMYRRQRHIYDLSRKFYLLGRNEAIARLRPAPGDKVLEIACGTGRNLVILAQAYPGARLFGLDVSREMLATRRHLIAANVILILRITTRPRRPQPFRVAIHTGGTFTDCVWIDNTGRRAC